MAAYLCYALLIKVTAFCALKTRENKKKRELAADFKGA